ncbi:MAG: class I SAM-dependent methyltransferase [Bacilli bacterium]|nr:class I SAM-dependent methyltransferase [Bacilli bacterium]
MSHYFMNDESLVSQVRELIYKYASFSFTFLSDNGVFSKKSIDYGSRLLLETYLKEEDTTGKKVLDVGCGYGFIGTVISVVTDSYVDMVDVNKRAVHLTKRNIKKQGKFKGNVFLSDAYSEVKDKYDVVITNPPIRVGKEKLLSILTGAFEHLNEDGALYFVIRKDQGALSIKKTLEKDCIVETINKDKGYFIYKVKKMEK